MDRLIECVPNFSEGRDRTTIDAITAAMERAGAKVLDVEMGAAANRTVVTLAGPPETVLEAAFEGIRTAADRIDMTRHHGEHPRLGATDVCPLVPLRGVTLEECAALARSLGERVGRELGIPVFLYEAAATRPERTSLATIRQGEYEGLEARLQDPDWQPDFGPARFLPRTGAVVIGARPILIAYNVNLNTRDRTLASRIAVRVREAGGIARGTDGERLLDPEGRPVKVPGTLRAVRAVGWVIDEYGIAQVSVNLLDHRVTPLHEVFEEVRRQADSLGVRVTGSEVVGLLPLEALLQAGRHYLERQGACPEAPEPDLVHLAVRSLGLHDARPFDPRRKVIEYRLEEGESRLTDLPVTDFVHRVSGDAPTPGGGSVAALAGALGSALVAMVGNLTWRRPERKDDREELARLAREAQNLKERLLRGVHEDSAAFDAILAARRLPQGTDSEKAARAEAIRRAEQRAVEVPWETLEAAARVAELAAQAVAVGYEQCRSDAGAAAAMAVAAAEGAALNVRINLVGRTDPEAESLRRQALEVLSRARGAGHAALSALDATL
ncbi:MAG TPA: glutamate formimidoyltransferase [Myxococcota bacterium]|nr:glutamate formimidoyltransferase [Myxococcota bacterium]HQK51867.1 glutamate formimidoyltransferase [Myxococcota bacterium]